MAQPSFKQLEAFWWAAHCRSFVAAAERLHLSVSSLSKRISELEAVLGQALFDRSGHRAQLTPQGEALLPAALEVLNAMAALGRSLAAGDTLAGPCRVGVGDLSALTWLPALVAAVRQAHPRLQLQPVVDVGAVLAQRLAEGELDCAVIAGQAASAQLQSQAVGAAHFAWAAAPALLHSHPQTTAAALLAHHPLITLPPGAGTTRLLDDWLLARRLEPRERLLCNSWAAVAGMLRLGLGLGFLPAGWIAPLGLVALTDGPADRSEACDAPSLQPLHYAVHWRRGDARALLPALQRHIQATVDFALLPCLLGR